MKISEMYPSKYLSKKDVGEGRLFTVDSVIPVEVSADGGEKEHKFALTFLEVEKPMILNATNTQMCAQMFDSEETADWAGKKLVVYNDPNISFGGKLVGGLRVRKPWTKTPPPPRHMAADDDYEHFV